MRRTLMFLMLLSGAGGASLILTPVPADGGRGTCGGFVCHWDQYCDRVMDRCMACYGLCRPGRINGDSFAQRECQDLCPEYLTNQKVTGSSSVSVTQVTLITDRLAATLPMVRTDSGTDWSKLNTYILIVLVGVLTVLTLSTVVGVVLLLTRKIKETRCTTAEKQVMTETPGGSQEQRDCGGFLQMNGSVLPLGLQESTAPAREDPRANVHHPPPPPPPPQFVEDVRSHNRCHYGPPSASHRYSHSSRDDQCGQLGSHAPLLDSSDLSDGAYSRCVTVPSENETLLKMPAVTSCA